MKKNTLSTILLFVVFFAGLSLLLYPTLSNYWNSIHQSKVISDYVENVAAIDEKSYNKMLGDAADYNNSLLSNPNRFTMSEQERAAYEKIINISSAGVMGYIEIPSINVSLPIYHGTSDAVLQVAVGHVEGSSIPIGGENTHSVLSGHRGLPSAKLFTNLDKLATGDIFVVRVLNETITYEADKISIVKPGEMSLLEIENGKDLCTLVTCTPYGINTHRLLVRGHRVENRTDEKKLHIISEAAQIDPIIVALALAIPILAVLFIFMIAKKPKNKEKNEK